MPAPIKTVAVIGTGVIGASWTALFLAHGLHVTVSDPGPGAKSKLEAYLSKEWPTMEKIGLAEGASLSNYTFVENIDEHLPNVDFVQEVRY
jgi:3-hydroxyacyl-CoA dehydrogenase